MFHVQIALVLFLCGTSLSQDANCDFRQNVEVGRNYYVFSPNYPNNYTRGVQCRWIARCPQDYHCRLACFAVRMPYSRGCTEDRLLIDKTGDPQLNQADRYCGLRSLITVMSSGQDISVALIASTTSLGGRFPCLITASLAVRNGRT